MIRMSIIAVAIVVYVLMVIAHITSGDGRDRWIRPLTAAATHLQHDTVQAMHHSWMAYKRCGFGSDEIAPVRCAALNWGPAPLGITLIDSLDTLYIMGMKQEFSEAVEHLVHNHTFDVDVSVSFFETTIRLVGGLISAYELSGDDRILAKAIDLGERLLAAIPEGQTFPHKMVNLKTRTGVDPVKDPKVRHPLQWQRSVHMSLAEAGTLQLEFAKLAELSGNPVFRSKSDRMMVMLYKGLNQTTGTWSVRLERSKSTLWGEVTLGARGDSFFEYQAKMYLLTGDALHRKAFERSYAGIRDNLLTLDGRFINRLDIHHHSEPVMEHLACFYPGVLAMMAVRCTRCKYRNEWRTLAVSLADGCRDMYLLSPLGIAPNEVQQVRPALGAPRLAFTERRYNMLRPEAIEAWCWLHMATGHPKYQQWGADALASFNRYARHPEGGYHEVPDVSVSPDRALRAPVPPRNDRMHSFWTAETLKYLYLMSSPRNMLADGGWVLNTEAHPFLPLP